MLRADGAIRTTWHHIHNPSKISANTEPDFSSIE